MRVTRRFSVLLQFAFCLSLGIISSGCKPDAASNGKDQSSDKTASSAQGANSGQKNSAGQTGQTGQTGVRKFDETKKASSLRALKLLEAGRFDEAWEECQRVLLSKGDDPRGLFVSSQVLSQRGKLDQAVGMVDRIPIAEPEYGLKAHRDALLWSWNKSQLGQAESRAKGVLAQYPDDYETNRIYAALLDLQGRRYEASLVMQKLLRLGNREITTLALAVDTVKPVESDAIVKQRMLDAPQEIRLKSSLGFGALYEKRPEEAEVIFREVLQAEQGTAALWVGLGLALIDQEKWDAFPQWYSSKSMPQVGGDAAEALPEYWRAIGAWMQAKGEISPAAKCYTRSVELDPMNYLAYGPLAQCYTLLDQPELAKQAEGLFQSAQLANRNLNYCRDGHRREEWIDQLASVLDTHGRGFEAILWRELSEKHHRPMGPRLKELEAAEKVAADESMSRGILSGLTRSSETFPSIDWDGFLGRQGSIATNGLTSKSESTGIGAIEADLGWSDVAKEMGADIPYRNGDDPNQLGMQTYQSNGAGAGVIDFDRDGWPDLFVLQGGGDPRKPETNDPSVLLRNISGKAFESVASLAGVANRAYGQGVAVGDVDQDGFLDLFVLNFGENLLLRNQGDGTFQRVPVPLMRRDIEQHPVWSVSGAIADIDGDHLPDVVEVNYASGIDVITHLCVSREQVPQVCRPTEFPASGDQLYLSDGAGGFVSGNERWKLSMDDGRGLGLIVGNLDRKHGNDLYIANDMSANNLYLSGPLSEGSRGWSLADEAVRRGCAVDLQGKPQASMGVGCADVDRNGTLDLFMTNFIDEYNALYLQDGVGFFQDASRRYKLIDPKKKTLGFGTQLLDIDCDGWLDMLIVNGHVDDYRSKGQPYAMRSQVFMQREGGFIEEASDRLGSYFQAEYLSRCLGVWDFNRDGRVDSYVTHLDHPLSVLRNEVKGQGNWLAIDLVGVESERDAIGAEIELKGDGQTWVHQRLAGNGFECANEGFVHFGVGKLEVIDSLEVRWPSGRVSRFEKVDVNRRVLLIESSEVVHEVLLEQQQR